jgi:16S rRNA (guanine1207-N2)-methyltransferase
MSRTPTRFDTPFGSYDLELAIADPSGSLRPWDAADEYVLESLADGTLSASARGATLIMNESTGELATALHKRNPLIFTDSRLSWSALLGNRQRNGLSAPETPASLLDSPRDPAALVLIKIPKTLSLLEHQLRLIAPALTADTLVVGAGMSRHIHSSTVALFETLIGETRTTRARKKARLIVSRPAGGAPSPGDIAATVYQADGIPAPLVNLPGLFSRERVDGATALLLENLTVPTGPVGIADFGCGNGILGIRLASANPNADVEAVDDSFLAVESARRNAAANGVAERVTPVWGSRLTHLQGPFDLVVSNPPFHQAHRNTIAPALELFRDACALLKPGGRLTIVANRHLGYAVHLRKLFGACREIAGNKTFSVLEAEVKQ